MTCGLRYFPVDRFGRPSVTYHGISWYVRRFLNRLKQNIDEEREGNMDQLNQRDHLDQMILEIVQQIQNQ